MTHNRGEARKGRHDAREPVDYDVPKWQGKSQRQIEQSQDVIIWLLRKVAPWILLAVAASLTFG